MEERSAGERGIAGTGSEGLERRDAGVKGSICSWKTKSFDILSTVVEQKYGWHFLENMAASRVFWLQSPGIIARKCWKGVGKEAYIWSPGPRMITLETIKWNPWQQVNPPQPWSLCQRTSPLAPGRIWTSPRLPLRWQSCSCAPCLQQAGDTQHLLPCGGQYFRLPEVV